MQCREVDSYAELSFDGELDAADRAELESHLSRCANCRRRVETVGWFHSQVRARLQVPDGGDATPDRLRTRVSARIRAEERRKSPPLTRALPVTLGIAALATLSFTDEGAAALDPEASVQRHASPLPPEIRALGDPSGVRSFLERNFDKAVRVPRGHEALPHLRLVGARLDHMANNRRAAILMYDHRGARVSVLVSRLETPPSAPPRFEVRTIAGQPVWLGQHRGYNVLAWKRGTFLYSAVSDIDEHQLIRLVGAF